MIFHKFSDTERDTAYSSILFQKDYIKLEDLNEIADELLKPFSDIDNEDSLPRVFLLHKEIVSELNDRIKSISKIADILKNNHILDCDEITIVDYGCGQGFASLALLSWFLEKKENLNSVKQVILVDKDKDALKRALLHYSVLFPKIDVIAYKQDLFDENFYIECKSVMTINLFSHILECDFRLLENIKHLILKSHNILMHNIFLEKISSFYFRDRIKSYYFNYVLYSINNHPDTEIIKTETYHLKPITNHTDKVDLFRYGIVSRTKITELSINDIDYHYKLLCPGNAFRRLFNVPQKILYFERPLENTNYCDNLDNKIMIWGKTIKYCAEHFEQYAICEALSDNLPESKEILNVYEKAAKDGVTEAYNNLAVLFLLLQEYNKTDYKKQIIDYLNLAIEGGSPYAMINLASFYMQGNIHDKAIDLYKLAAKSNHYVALFNLAVIMNFGLYNHEIDLNKAEDLYQRCIKDLKPGILQSKSLDEVRKEESRLRNICELNLMLLMEKKGAHYLDICDFYHSINKPTKEVDYCYNILSIKHTLRFNRHFIKKYIIQSRNDIVEESFMTYNRAVFLYFGLELSDYDKISANKQKGLSIIKSLAEEKTKEWYEKDKYIYEFFENYLFERTDSDKINIRTRYKDLDYDPVYPRVVINNPSEKSEFIYQLLSKDYYYERLQHSADQCHSQSLSLMPFVAKLRDNIYNYIYWAYLYCKDNNDIQMKLDLFDFFKSKCNKSLDVFFRPVTICEKIMLELAEDIASNTENIDFICKLGDFYLNGNNSYWAVKFYNIAKDKGCESKNAIIDELNSRIEEEDRQMKLNRQLFDDRLENYYDPEDRWYAMTDGQYGDYPGGDIDYDIFGF